MKPHYKTINPLKEMIQTQYKTILSQNKITHPHQKIIHPLMKMTKPLMKIIQACGLIRFKQTLTF